MRNAFSAQRLSRDLPALPVAHLVRWLGLLHLTGGEAAALPHASAQRAG